MSDPVVEISLSFLWKECVGRFLFFGLFFFSYFFLNLFSLSLQKIDCRRKKNVLHQSLMYKNIKMFHEIFHFIPNQMPLQSSSHLITMKQQNFVQCLTFCILKVSSISLDFQWKYTPISVTISVSDFVFLIFLEKVQHIVISYSSNSPTEHWVQDFVESALIFSALIEKGHILCLTWEKATPPGSTIEANN